MPSSRDYDPEDIDDVRRERNRVKGEMHELVSQGASLTKAQKDDYEVLEKELEQVTADLRRLKKKKKHGTGGTRRRRQTRRKTKRSRK
jgi:hypothetical protein